MSVVWGQPETSYVTTELADMSLEQLMNIEIPSSASLTNTTVRTQPSAVTTISREQIHSSGARSLDELLDIYVPNLQMILDYYQYQTMGLRGIIGERANKFLLLVNGREMNEHTEYGALSERDLPMLTDIHHIDIVRGPGSNLYGPGALSMVINIITESGATFQGTEVTSRLGAIEEFYSTEVKHGHRFKDNSSIFAYAGISEYPGARECYSPDYHEVFPLNDYQYYNDQQQWRDLPKLKFHIEYQKEDLTVWTRYTRGGMNYRSALSVGPDEVVGTGYQQFSIQALLRQPVTETFELEYSAGFDMFDYQQGYGYDYFAHREDEYAGKIIGRWTPNDRHSLAVGTAISREVFGKQSPGLSDVYPDIPWVSDYNDDGDLVTPEWWTTLYSFFAEYQYKIHKNWTAFLGARMDKQTYTPRMYSPRGVLVYTPTDEDTFKFSASKSARMNYANELKGNWIREDKATSPEELKVYEIRYERQHSDKVWLAASFYSNDHDIVGYDSSTGSYGSPVGNMETLGMEVELIYKTENFHFTASHGFSKMQSFTPPSDESRQWLTAAPFGYGNDNANWSNHVSKFVAGYKLTENLTWDSSLRIYWGMPGAKDYAKYSIGDSDEYQVPKDKFYGPSMFLNTGFGYKVNNNLEIRVDGYNLLGLVDKHLNKRMYGFDYCTDFRSVAPAVGVSVFYRF